VCTVLLRWRPDGPWPLLMAAVRDEFLDRPWDPPAPHWPAYPSLVGGRDRQAGGTWLAVDPTRPAVAAVLNGVRLPPEPSRPSRGRLPLAALTDSLPTTFAGYDGFHLLIGTLSSVTVLSWDGVSLVRRELAPGDHIIVNAGVDATEDPLVPHFAPLLAALPDPPLALVDGPLALADAPLALADPALALADAPPVGSPAPPVGSSPPPVGSPAPSTVAEAASGGSDRPAGTDALSTTLAAWGPWLDLMRGDGLPPDDPRALLLRREFDGSQPGLEQYAGRVYGSGSAALVALAPGRVRYDFTPTPFTPAWRPILPTPPTPPLPR